MKQIKINKIELNKAVNELNLKKIKELTKDLDLYSLLHALDDKHRFVLLYKKADLDFTKGIIKYLKELKEKTELGNSKKFSVQIIREDNTYLNIETVSRNSKEVFYKSYMNKPKNCIEFSVKLFHKVLENRKDADLKFIKEAIKLMKEENLKDKYTIRRFAKLLMNSNFTELLEDFAKLDLLNSKDIKRDFLIYVVNRTNDIEKLNAIKDKYGKDLFEAFLERNNEDEFWYDFILNKKNEYQRYLDVKNIHIEKMIWLEENHMGYSQIKEPHYIKFLNNLPKEDLDYFFSKVNEEKYLNRINEDLIVFNEMQLNKTTNKHLDLGLLDDFNYVCKRDDWKNKDSFGSIMSKRVLTYELEKKLSNKDDIKNKDIKKIKI